jgi:hypothetical protein
MNIRGLPRSDAFDMLSIWLNKCDSVCKLRFSTSQKINMALDMVGCYLPKGREKLKHDHLLVCTTRQGRNYQLRVGQPMTTFTSMDRTLKEFPICVWYVKDNANLGSRLRAFDVDEGTFYNSFITTHSLY